MLSLGFVSSASFATTRLQVGSHLWSVSQAYADIWAEALRSPEAQRVKHSYAYLRLSAMSYVAHNAGLVQTCDLFGVHAGFSMYNLEPTRAAFSM